MSIALPFLVLLLIVGIAAYHRFSLAIFTAIAATALVAVGIFGGNFTATVICGVMLALFTLPLLLTPFRQQFITKPLLSFYTKILPPLSDTERVALEAGTVGFEGELFSGNPKWDVLLKQPKPVLTAEEQAFIDGPVEQVCKMCNDWETTHVRNDLSPEIWEFLKKNKFFGMIIPKEFGGLGFSAFAHHRVIMKLASLSATLS
ncbi:MAG: acyl-CoA dehydrogenase family protein, partial [Arenimonas sp.]